MLMKACLQINGPTVKIHDESSSKSSSRSAKHSFLTLYSTSRSMGVTSSMLVIEDSRNVGDVERVETGSVTATVRSNVCEVLVVDMVSLLFAYLAKGAEIGIQRSVDAIRRSDGSRLS